MSNLSLDLLIDAGLITSAGKIVDFSSLSNAEISSRISQYSNARIETLSSEINTYYESKWLKALFSTSSVKTTKGKLLSSALIYESIIINDPLVSSSSSISYKELKEGLELFSWAFDIIRAGFIKVIPLSYINKPSDGIPLLHSDDAFKSSIPKEIHDFIHKNAILKSVVQDNNGQMLLLSEQADIERRTALNVSFKNDFWISGVSLYLFQTIENGIIKWDKNSKLSKEKFEYWAYQTVNQAMRTRLAGIYNESHLAYITGHTYITESRFESEFMAMTGNSNCSSEPISAKFLNANNSFINIDSPRTVLELREKYSTAFERFNYTLQHITEELSEVDASSFDRKAENLFHKEIMPQVDEIRDNINLISSSTTKGILSSLIGLSAAIATGSSLPLIPALMSSVAAGLTEAFPAISQQERLKTRPAYIWHRLIKT